MACSSVTCALVRQGRAQPGRNMLHAKVALWPTTPLIHPLHALAAAPPPSAPAAAAALSHPRLPGWTPCARARLIAAPATWRALPRPQARPGLPRWAVRAPHGWPWCCSAACSRPRTWAGQAGGGRCCVGVTMRRVGVRMDGQR